MIGDLRNMKVKRLYVEALDGVGDPAVDFLLPMAQNAFSETGELTDVTALRRLKRYVNGLADWAGKLV